MTVVNRIVGVVIVAPDATVAAPLMTGAVNVAPVLVIVAPVIVGLVSVLFVRVCVSVVPTTTEVPGVVAVPPIVGGLTKFDASPVRLTGSLG